MKIGCPHMGEYTELIKDLGEYLGWEVYLCPSPSDKTVELGARYMNELMCLPAKVTLGSLIEACEKGVRHFLMFDSCGQCRLKCYWILQQRELTKLGYDVTVHPVRMGPMMPRDIRAIDSSIPYWKACWAIIKLVRRVIELDNKLWVEIMDETSLVKIGIVGEIYTMLEPAVNRDIIKKIEKMGALVHNSLPLSYFIFKRFYNWGLMKRKGIERKTFKVARKLAHEYFPKEIGGHGNETIIHTIYYALKKFDGVLHILPFPCAPEATVAPILDDIRKDYSISVMRLIFDTHTGEAGLNTRIEAFVDMLQTKKAKL